MVIRVDMWVGMTDIRVNTLLLRRLVTAAFCANVGAVVESILVGLDIVAGVIPGVILGPFHGFILG